MQPTLKQLVRLAELFSVLSDPVRLRILQCIQKKPFCVSTIMRRCALKQANTSRHLRILREANIVATERRGTSIFYHISDPIVIELCDLVCKADRKKVS